MKSFKALNLLAVAAVTATAFAASASATSVTTSTGGAAATPTIHVVNEGGHVTLINAIANVSCASTLEGAITQHGTGIPSDGKFFTILFTGCTNSWHVTAANNGTFAIHWTSGHNGVIESSDFQLDMTRFGVTCVYETEDTYIGVLTGGSPLTIHVDAVLSINSALSGALCNKEDAGWEGRYVTTSALYIGS